MVSVADEKILLVDLLENRKTKNISTKKQGWKKIARKTEIYIYLDLTLTKENYMGQVLPILPTKTS